MTLPPKYPLQTLMAVEAKHVAELNKILAMAVNRLDQDIKALGKAGANPLTIMQAQATRASLASFIGEVFDEVEGSISLGLKNAAAAASGVVSAYEAQMLGLVMSPEAMANLAKSEAQRAAMGIEAAMQRVLGNSYQPLSSTVYKTQQLTLKWVDKRIAQGLASGWSASKLAGELKGMIDPAVKGGVSYAAMRTARTEINNAFHASSAERYLNSPVVLEVDWHLSSSHPEGDVCDDLQANSPYPKKSVPQKPHPQCYCYITPSLPEPAKFVDNLFKGKYGSPPSAAAVQELKANLPKAAGSKAAKTMAQNAMHQAIKTDKAPTKASLGKQMGIAPGKIADAQSFSELLAKLDADTLEWVKKTPGAKAMMAGAEKGLDDLDTLANWATKNAKPKTKEIPKFAPEPLPSGPIKIVYDDELYDDLNEFMSFADVDILKKNGINPEQVKFLIDGMDEDDFSAFTKIVFNAEDGGDGVKHLLAVMDLDSSSNSFSGALQQLAKGSAPKKVPTYQSIKEEFQLGQYWIDEMDMLNMTPDQMQAQLLKYSADELAAIKKLDVATGSHHIKFGTTPSKPATLAPDMPITPASAPTYNDIAQLLKLSGDDLMESGATPQQIWYMLYGEGKGVPGLLDALKVQTAQMQKTYLLAAKNIDLPKQLGADFDDWMKANKFIDADVPAPKSYYSFMDLEQEYGTPEDVWQGTGWSADEIKDAIDWIDDNDLVLQKQIIQAFDDFDQDMLENAIKQGMIKKKVPKPAVKPETLPDVKVPDPLPVPKEVYESYEDVADIFVKGEWKPNLLKNTGATPQQIADYVEDMSQAQYDHFMSLKWPSQKKHFEKLATKTDNATTYAAKVDVAEGAALDAAKIGKPMTSDPEVLAKWRGKNQPGKPIEPKPPAPVKADAEFKAFIDGSKQKFKDFAASTGNLKNDLTKSNNWSYFQNVVNNNDLNALKYLKDNKYIDDALQSKAMQAIVKATTPNADDAMAYKKAMEAYAKAKSQFDLDLVQWREANGITSAAKGVWDGALAHADNGAGVRWANSNLPTATGQAQQAIKKYSGSSYSSWNSALRRNANGDALPAGEWAEWTRKADQGMVGMPEDVIVRRGTGWDEFAIGGERKGFIPPPPPHELIGSVQTQHGYTSTSVGNSSAFGGQVNMRIRVPQGHGAAWVDPYSSHQGERELLLSRSTNMYIHDVYQENGKWYVDAEVIPRGEDATTWTPIKSTRRA